MTQTVLITGCSSGFGTLIAQTFARQGWKVVATMRSPGKVGGLTEGDRMAILRLDVTDPASIAAAFTAGRARFGEIGVVVNNAGYGGDGLFEQTTDRDARAMFETNVFGPMNVMREALPEMRRAGHGVIVNVTSMAGHVGLPHHAIYAASKYALVGLSESLAMEYGSLGIRVHSVAPGAYPTTRFNQNTDQRLDRGDDQLVSWSHRLRDQFAKAAEQMAQQIGKAPDPQEVADRVFACATREMPVHIPTGDDAGMLMAMMGQEQRQAFIDQITAMLVPPPEDRPD